MGEPIDQFLCGMIQKYKRHNEEKLIAPFFKSRSPESLEAPI